MKGTFFRKASSLLLALLMVQFLVTCATNPVTGKKELSFLSNAQEIQLGTDADKSIIAQYGLYDDPEVAVYVDQIGQKMAKISHRPELQFHFRVLDSPVINAFALPGGYVYFTRGILAYMNSEAELAGVMGHEIGHVTARHGAKAYTRGQLAQVGFGVGYILSDTFRKFAGVAQMGIGLIFLRFSRDQERQSDELGVEYSTKVAYDAREMSDFFGTLNSLQEQSGQSLPGWFSTHPNPGDRVVKTLQLAEAAQQNSEIKNFKVNRDHHLNMVEGLVFGEDPRQGFVEDNMFYQPTLDFQFPVPTNWLLLNTPQVVQMGNKEKTAGIQFTLAQQKTARSAADQFVIDSKATVIGSKRTRVNGFIAEIRETTIASQQGDLRVLSFFIEKDTYVYLFHGFSADKDFRNHKNTFQYTMTGFDQLRNENARRVKPNRIKVVRASRNTTMQDFLARYPNDKVKPETLAIINGKKLTDPVKRGERIKVVTK